MDRYRSYSDRHFDLILRDLIVSADNVGKAGVCLATLGPGATNCTTAAAYAHLGESFRFLSVHVRPSGSFLSRKCADVMLSDNVGAFPALFITGQKPLLKSKQGAFQIVDVVSLLRPITKYSKQVCFLQPNWNVPLS